MQIYHQRLWNVFNYWISRAHQNDDQSEVNCIGIEETSGKKGHVYDTLSVDLERKKVLYACEGKDEQSIAKLKQHLHNKAVPAEQIEHVSMEMSPAFISGVCHNFPEAAIVFDRFHITKMLNEAVDDVRKQEAPIHKAIKGHKSTFLKHDKNLSSKQIEAKYDLMEDYPSLGEIVRLREVFNDYWDFRDVEEASAFLSYWCETSYRLELKGDSMRKLKSTITEF